MVIRSADEVMNGARTAARPARHSHWIVQREEGAQEELSPYVCAPWQQYCCRPHYLISLEAVAEEDWGQL